ncbi:uncharacterized protein LOC144424563 [Styela clava]
MVLNITNYTTTTTTNVRTNTLSIMIAFQVINGILLLCTIWLLLCMLIYGTKKHKWKKTSGASSMNCGIIYAMCVVAVIFSLPRLIGDCILFNLTKFENGLQYCEMVSDLTNGAYSVSTYMTYFFLWLRQKIIYAHPSVRPLAAKCVKPFTWFALVVFSVLSPGLSCIYTIPDQFSATPYGCSLTPLSERDDYEEFIEGVGQYVLAGALVVIQTILLGLFVYPMILSNREMKDNMSQRINSDKKTKLQTEGFTGMKSRVSSFIRTLWLTIVGNPGASPVARTIHRSMIGCAVVVISDLAAMGIVTRVPLDLPRVIANTIYDISTLVNLLCLLTTFGNNVQILTVVCMSCAEASSTGYSTKPKKTSEIASTSNDAICVSTITLNECKL